MTARWTDPMKHYTDPDPLHGHGKSMPKPKQPNPRGTVGSNYTPRRIHPGAIGKCCVNGCRKSG